MDRNDREVFKVAVRQIPNSCEKVIEKAGRKKDDDDFVAPNQTNIRIMKAARERIGIPEEKMAKSIHKYGNNSSASIPIALSESLSQGKIQDDDVIVLVGFGGGLTWGAVTLRWGK